MAQVDLGAGAIGGKDSMSGSFENLDVPPTLISFAVAVGSYEARHLPRVQGCRPPRGPHRAALPGRRPDPGQGFVAGGVLAVEELTDPSHHVALAVSTPGYGATAEALFKMTLGNRIGVKLDESIAADDLFEPAYGSFIIELADNAKIPVASNLVEVSEIGTTTAEYVFKAAGETLDLANVQEAWEGGIESVFPYRSKSEEAGKTR